MQSTIAVASSSGVELGIGVFVAVVSGKIGRMSRVQSGQIAGAAEFRLAHKIPATNVPCMHEMLLVRSHVLLIFPETSWIFAFDKSRRLVSTGPSMRATLVCSRPRVICMSGESCTRSRGLGISGARRGCTFWFLWRGKYGFKNHARVWTDARFAIVVGSRTWQQAAREFSKLRAVYIPRSGKCKAFQKLQICGFLARWFVAGEAIV